MIIPTAQRTNYKKALLGKNRKAAIFLFCIYKCKFKKDAVMSSKNCNEVDCPLWPYREGDSEPSPYYVYV